MIRKLTHDPCCWSWVGGLAATAGADDAACRTAKSPNMGDNESMMVATPLVLLMSMPGLALFYGGMVRAKNMLSVLIQVFAIFSLILVLWAVYGYSWRFPRAALLWRADQLLVWIFDV